MTYPSNPQPYGYPPANQPPYGAPLPSAHAGYSTAPAVYTAVFRKETGMLIIAQTTPVQTTGTYPEIRSAFWKAQTHCLLFGWWGVLSFLIYNWVTMVRNINELSRIKQAARVNGEL